MLRNQNNLVVASVLSINILATLAYLFFLSSDSRKKKFFGLPVWIQKSFVLLFVGPLFGSPFIPQAHFPPVGLNYVRVWVGAFFSAIGFCFIIASFLKIGAIPSLRKKSGLVTQGVYGVVRHPIYAGTILAFLGLNLMLDALVALLYLPVSIFLYWVMTNLEEKSLLSEYGQEYRAYQQKVRKRIIPFVI